MKKGQSLPVDKFVGNRVRMRRIDMGMTQEKLAEVLKISFQQIQKYEKGINRISSSKLAGMADVLKVPVSWFFEGAPGNTGSAQTPIETNILEFMATKEGLSIARNFPIFGCFSLNARSFVVDRTTRPPEYFPCCLPAKFS